MEQVNIVASSQKESHFRNRAIGAGVAALAILAPNSSPASSAESTSFAPAISASTESVSYNALAAKSKKKKKLSCKKINKVRNKAKRPLKKKEKKFLKKKCGIKYPNILGSTKNTKVSGSIAYNWGPEPLDTGMKNPVDESYFEFNSLVQTKFGKNGQVITQKGIGASVYYDVNSGNTNDVYEFDQPKISRQLDNYDYGVILKYDAINRSDETKGLSVTLKEYPTYQRTFIDTTLTLPPDEPIEVFISDSADQPLSQFGYQKLTGREDIIGEGHQNLYVLSPNSESSAGLKNITRAVLKMCVISDYPGDHCYTRAVVTGKSNIFD